MHQNKIALGIQAFQQAQQAHAGKDYEQAARLYRKALALMPDNPKVLLEASQLAMEMKDWASAEALFRKIGKLRPQSNYEGYLGEALFRQGKFAEAIPFFREYLARFPDNTDVMHALGNSLCSLGQWEEGHAKAAEAQRLRPRAKYLDSVLNALYHMGRVDELEALATEAIKQYPDSAEIRSMYALHKLKSGDLAEGFRFFTDFRWRNNINTAAHGGTPGEWWDGKPFDGTLLVTAEQGLGDELMASSIFGDIVAMGQKAVIECDARLVPVYRRSFPSLQFVVRGERRLNDIHDAGGNFRKINMLDLASLFRTTPGSFPARRRWLKADPERTAAFRARYQQEWPGKKLVGISWKSTRVMEGLAQKGAQLADFAPVLAVPDAVFINLQYGDIEGEIAALAASRAGQVHVDPDVDTMNDIDTVFAQTAALDLVVSTSNTAVHIAGALGVPCYLLLPKTRPMLWYWGYRGERTPWYPSLHLLRNPREDNWQELMADVARRVAEERTPAP